MKMDKHFKGHDGVRKAFDRSRSQPFELDRDGGLPLQFTGSKIASASIKKEGKNGTEVSIYETVGGQIVTHVFQWQKNSGGTRQKYSAGVHQTPEEALTWLIEDGEGRLGVASKRAWTAACASHERFAGLGVEVIE